MINTFFFLVRFYSQWVQIYTYLCVWWVWSDVPFGWKFMVRRTSICSVRWLCSPKPSTNITTHLNVLFVSIYLFFFFFLLFFRSSSRVKPQWYWRRGRVRCFSKNQNKNNNKNRKRAFLWCCVRNTSQSSSVRARTWIPHFLEALLSSYSSTATMHSNN